MKFNCKCNPFRSDKIQMDAGATQSRKKGITAVQELRTLQLLPTSAAPSHRPITAYFEADFTITIPPRIRFILNVLLF